MTTRPAIVCGGRDFRGTEAAARWLRLELLRHDATVVYHGDAKGADQWAARIAEVSLHLPARKFPAEWDRYGKRAGFVRNYAMAAEAIAHGRVAVCLALPGGAGTADMVRQAERVGIPVVRYDGPSARPTARSGL